MMTHKTELEPITLRIPQACAYVGVSRSLLYELLAKNRIESVRIGGVRLVKTASLRRFIEEAEAA